MEAHENEQYVTFPLSGVHDSIQDNIISHEEICEPVDECVLPDPLTEVSVTDVNSGITEAQVAVEILAEQSDEEDENRVVYPIYIKQEEQQQYTSGDDESMAVEALRQLGGMYPCFEDKKVSCPNCANVYTQADMTKHHTTCNATKLSCMTCGERFERKIDLNNHMVCHQVDRPHACRTCGNLFRSKSNLRCHMLQVHQVERPHKCTMCGADFQRPSSLSNHMKIHTYVAGRTPNNKWGKHACSECSKKFTTKQKMFRHQWIHRKKTHSCEVCGAQFEKQNQLDEHRLSAHPGDSPFTCTECGKSFVSRQGLWEHGRTHAGSPAHFHCDTCSKTFSSRQGYLIHHRTHTGERPYGCKFCWKAFRDGGTLRKHERIHTGERPHVCPLCSRAFNQKVVLREHVRWVHAAGKNETEVTGPPFLCPICGALNQDRDELCAHIVKHSDQMIAEAKAKTNNNAPKTKPVKKKTKTSASTNLQEKQGNGNRIITKTEENEALLSITDADKSDDQQILDDKQNNTFLVVTTEKRNENYIEISELKTENVQLLVDEKQNENMHISQTNHNHRESLNMITIDKQNNTAHIVSTEPEGSALHSTTSHNEITAMHLIQTSKQANTLHLISKQNESLPVLALPNPQSHENFSSQIAQISNSDLPMNMVTHHSTRQDQDMKNQGAAETAVIQVVQYHQQESDDGEELVCGICGEDFTDKNVLMEHVKIHI
ncbi:Zinc finger protein 585B [Habropoda laboriosa]|uniref:Zinc finger protein 585B n=1 Tax=Habropoda laboriosa TaxID=597456 RepID=A0A0L7RJH0_9HYME|nr:Zinc finger protein 585B [Habropoda laboriosa]